MSASYNVLGDHYFKHGKWEKALQNYQLAIIADVIDFNDSDIYSNPNLDSISSKRYLLWNLYRKATALEQILQISKS